VLPALFPHQSYRRKEGAVLPNMEARAREMQPKTI
jgi:hypothetical protein